MDPAYKKSNIYQDALEFGLLTVVADGEKSASLILENLKAFDFQFEEANLFPMLKKLSRRGLLNSIWKSIPGGIPQKIYSITDSGEHQLAELRQTWRSINNNMNSILNI